jgi:hypothetical protein
VSGNSVTITYNSTSILAPITLLSINIGYLAVSFSYLVSIDLLISVIVSENVLSSTYEPVTAFPLESVNVIVPSD